MTQKNSGEVRMDTGVKLMGISEVKSTITFLYLLQIINISGGTNGL